jgi:hypothetical protein
MVGLTVALGGLHGWGGFAVLIAEAPVFALELILHFDAGNGPFAWVVVTVINWIYFFLLVLVARCIFRLLRTDRRLPLKP